MSFGFGIGDVITVGRLLDDVINSTRRASSEFAEFTQDLQLASSLFQILRDSSETYTHRTASLSQQERLIIGTTFAGIRDGLLQLQERLNQHSSVGPGPSHLVHNVRFSRALERLRRRLDVHMNSLRLIVQNVQLAQVSEIGGVVARIERAQQENRQIDGASDEGSLSENARNDGYASNASQQMRYELPETGGPRSVTSSTSTRDEFINTWRQHVQEASLSAIDERQSTLPSSTVASEGPFAPLPLPITPAQQQRRPRRDPNWRQDRLQESLRVACFSAAVQVVLGIVVLSLGGTLAGNSEGLCFAPSGCGSSDTQNLAASLYIVPGVFLGLLGALRVYVHLGSRLKTMNAFNRSTLMTLIVTLEIPLILMGIVAMALTCKYYKLWLADCVCMNKSIVGAAIAFAALLTINTSVMWYCYQRWQPTHFLFPRSCWNASCRPGYGVCCGDTCLSPCRLCGRIFCGLDW